jgi:hypothetical protein
MDLAAQLAADAAALQQRETVRRIAAAEPLPGPAAEAFAAGPVVLQGLTFRPATAGDVILLKQLDSPLIRRTAELVEHVRKLQIGELPPGTEPPVTPYDDEEAVEMVFQFTRPIAEVRLALREGRAAFRRRALETIADTRAYPDLNALVAAAEECYLAATRTFQRYRAADGSGGEERNFSTPPAGAPTASAGGSTTTAGSGATTG